MTSDFNLLANFYKIFFNVDAEFCQKVTDFRTRKWPPLNLAESRFVVFDMETTGFYPHKGDEIISLAGVVIEKGQLTQETFSQYVNPKRHIPPNITQLTGISNEMVADAADFITVYKDFMEFVGSSMLVAHCGAFDFSFINAKLRKSCGEKLQSLVLDTYVLAHLMEAERIPHSLEELAQVYDVPTTARHTALGDAIMTAKIFLSMVQEFQKKGIKTTRDLQYRLQYIKFRTQ